MSADIVVIDIIRGTEAVVAVTRAWDSQLGAQVQWGSTDDIIIYNDIVTHGDSSYRVAGVILNLKLGSKLILDCPVYHVSADGFYSASPEIDKIHNTQLGYGAYLPVKEKFSSSDKIYIANLTSGKCRTLIKLTDISNYMQFKLGTEIYGFHTKWSNDNKYILAVIRTMTPGSGIIGFRTTKRRQHIIIIESQTGEIKGNLLSFGGRHDHGIDTRSREKEHIAGVEIDMVDGNHPNWIPDSHDISMNIVHSPRGSLMSLKNKNKILRDIVKINFTKPCNIGFCSSSDLFSPMYEIVFPFRGSGHPNFLPGGRYAVVDTYSKEIDYFRENLTADVSKLKSIIVPLRLVDTVEKREINLYYVQIENFDSEPATNLLSFLDKKFVKKAWRCDMHPAFSRDFRWLSITARPNKGLRQILISFLGSDPSRLFNRAENSEIKDTQYSQ